MLDWRVFGSARDTGAFFLPLTLRMFFGGDAPEAAAGVAGALVALALDATLGAAALEGSADS